MPLIECRARLTLRKRSRRGFEASLDSFTGNKPERRRKRRLGWERKGLVKPVRQGFPNHDANLSCAFVEAISSRAVLISINAVAAACFKLPP
jgi:hypothetical protein